MGKPQQRHYKRVIPASSGVPSTPVWKVATDTTSWDGSNLNKDMWSGGLRPAITIIKMARWTLRPVYHATMRYIYDLPELDSKLAEVYAYMDGLGVKLDPSIVWNAIPFSFVVDWIVDVSGFLASFSRDNYPINTRVTDFCHSMAYRKEVEVYVNYTDDPVILANPQKWGGAPRPHGWIGVYTGSRSYYNRVRFNPDIHTARLKAPGLRQAALAGSLLLGRTALGNSRQYLRERLVKLRPAKARK